MGVLTEMLPGIVLRQQSHSMTRGLATIGAAEAEEPTAYRLAASDYAAPSYPAVPPRDQWVVASPMEMAKDVLSTPIAELLDGRGAGSPELSPPTWSLATREVDPNRCASCRADMRAALERRPYCAQCNPVFGNATVLPIVAPEPIVEECSEHGETLFAVIDKEVRSHTHPIREQAIALWKAAWVARERFDVDNPIRMIAQSDASEFAADVNRCIANMIADYAAPPLLAPNTLSPAVSALFSVSAPIAALGLNIGATLELFDTKHRTWRRATVTERGADLAWSPPKWTGRVSSGVANARTWNAWNAKNVLTVTIDAEGWRDRSAADPTDAEIAALPERSFWRFAEVGA